MKLKYKKLRTAFAVAAGCAVLAFAAVAGAFSSNKANTPTKTNTPTGTAIGTVAHLGKTGDRKTTSHAKAFVVSIDGAKVKCRTQYSTENTYGTNIETHRTPGFFKISRQNVASLSFQRVNRTNAFGGRCETTATNALSGNGTLTAHLRFPKNLDQSSGVFSVSIETPKYPSFHPKRAHERELDLFVADFPRGTLLMGNPYNHDVGTTMTDSLLGKWATIKMVRHGGTCGVSITVDNGTKIPLSNEGYASSSMPCNLADPGDAYADKDGVNKLVVNSRGRDGTGNERATVLISQIKWAKG